MKFESHDTNSLRSKIKFFLHTKRNLKMLKKNLEVFVKLFQVLFCGEKKICILDLNELVS